ncbi:MAG: lactate utilization protein C [Desulfobacterales bacterium]|nr:lactate utilization protein C [Desulfobacterales bacterium]
MNNKSDSLGEKRFLLNVRSALGYSRTDGRRFQEIYPRAEPSEIRRGVEKIQGRTRKERQALLEQLVEQGRPLNLKVIPLEDAREASQAIVDLVSRKNTEWGGEKRVAVWKHPLIDKLKLAEALAPRDIPVYTTAPPDAPGKREAVPAETRANVRKRVFDSFVGVTSADFCVADSATLVIKTMPGHARAASLVPSIHVAVIGVDRIVADLKELYTLLKRDFLQDPEGLTRCMTFISGPSKTADIELTMVHGAHGPRELYLYVLMGRDE